MSDGGEQPLLSLADWIRQVAPMMRVAGTLVGGGIRRGVGMGMLKRLGPASEGDYSGGYAWG